MSTTTTVEICRSSKKDSFSEAICLEEKAQNLFVILREKKISIPPPPPPVYPHTLFQSECKFAANRQDIGTKCRFMRLAYLYAVNRNNQSVRLARKAEIELR